MTGYRGQHQHQHKKKKTGMFKGIEIAVFLYAMTVRGKSGGMAHYLIGKMAACFATGASAGDKNRVNIMKPKKAPVSSIVYGVTLPVHIFC